MGCGRVGSTLAEGLEELGHSVAIIDMDAHAFRRLRPDFHGRKVHGMGLHRAVLEEAGIRHADAFAAVSSGDNSNIIAARVARETFGVENVVARIYDIRRAEIYQRLGIPTVATVKWTADQMLRRVLRSGAHWCDLPERYGPWKTVHKRFSRWAAAGVWERVFDDLTKDRDNQYLMLDSTLVRAHQQATTGRGSGSKRGASIRLWGVPEAD